MKIRNKQCKACPWKVSTVPDEDIPDGYEAKLHEDLRGTIADQSDPLSTVGKSLRVMACHEAELDAPYPCVGWVVNQLTDGNNIGLRITALDGRYSKMKVVGPQHACFEDTLPKKS